MVKCVYGHRVKWVALDDAVIRYSSLRLAAEICDQLLKKHSTSVLIRITVGSIFNGNFCHCGKWTVVKCLPDQLH